jgi:hypothetical protein
MPKLIQTGLATWMPETQNIFWFANLFHKDLDVLAVFFIDDIHDLAGHA